MNIPYEVPPPSNWLFASLPITGFSQTSFVVIDYSEVLELLKNTSILQEVPEVKEFSEILSVFVYEYFSRTDIFASSIAEDNYPRGFKKRMSLEQSSIAPLVFEVIEKITRAHLPGFTASNTFHCNSIINLSMRSSTALLLELDRRALKLLGDGNAVLPSPEPF